MARYRIMTFDGGGVRGALVVNLLQRLVATFPGLLADVDLFAGTSTGAVIALALAYGKTPKQLVEFYSEENLEYVFTPSRVNFIRPKYDNKHFIERLEGFFPGSPTFADIKKCGAMVASFQLDDEAEQDWNPVFFNNIADTPNLDLKITDAILRSAAAPTYFPSYQGYIDGGVMANNPSTEALAIAVDKDGGQADINEVSLLSFGTGFTPTLISSDTTNWGIVQWMLNPFHEPKEALLNILLDGAGEANDFTTGRILGDRYYRLNPTLPTPVALDDWKAVPELVATADSVDLNAGGMYGHGQIAHQQIAVADWIEQFWL